jgi:hypothetical protein
MAAAQVLRAGPLGQPDIGYTPDVDKYLARVKWRKESEKLESSLPEGFPSELHSDLVWEEQNVGEKFNWSYELNAVEIEEIEGALKHFKCLSSTPAAAPMAIY